MSKIDKLQTFSMSDVNVKETGLVTLIFPTKENIKDMLKVILKADDSLEEACLLSVLTLSNLLLNSDGSIRDTFVNVSLPMSDSRRRPYIWLDDMKDYITHAQERGVSLDTSTGILKVLMESELVAFDGTDKSFAAILNGITDTINELILER